MIKHAGRTIIIILFAFFWLFMALTQVYSRGRRDIDLIKADQLINEKRYDEATLILSDYTRRYPDRIEFAHMRLQRIYEIREEFNRTADELIETLFNEPGNSEKIIVLTQKLISLEHEDNPILKNFVSSINDIAQFNILRNQLRGILERGRQLLDRGEYEAAIQTYAGGMSIMRNDFYTAGYGEEIENTVRQETERVNSVIASFREISALLGIVSAEYESAVSTGQFAAAAGLTNRMTSAMDGFIDLKQELYTSVKIFDEILAFLQSANPEMGDRNHLSFVSRVIHGRTGEPIQEGMLGVFDAFWRSSAGSVIEAIASYTEDANTAALAAFNAEQYAAVMSGLENIHGYANLSPMFFEKNRLLNEGGDPQLIMLYENLILWEDIPYFLRIKSLDAANIALEQAANVARTFGSLRLEAERSSFTDIQDGSLTVIEALNREQQTRNILAGIQSEIDAIKAIAEKSDTEIDMHFHFPYIERALSAVDNLSFAVSEEERKSVQRYYSIAKNELDRSVIARRNELESSISFLDGQKRINADGTETILLYPAEALEVLTSMLSAISSDLDHGNSILTLLNNEPLLIFADPEIAEILAGYQAAVNELNSIRNTGIALADTARSRIARAEAHRQEGERLFREAQAALQRQIFNIARDRIQRASDRFNNSLEIQESESLRQFRDTQLVNLGQAIAVSENEAIITEVRNLLIEARTLYFAGNFQQAEDNLVRARNRWRVTNPDENEEILYWLGMVRSAMSMRSGRTIPPTAPLYPEMSQLLSQAQINFEEGVRYINAGQHAQGYAKFNEARIQTREVRLVFPVNQEAGILELKMEQFTNPEAFNASFEQRITTAINGTKQRSVESYADLLNLAEINPNYPGLRTILNQAEIDMGYRPPPPSQADIARSRELTASASRILEGNITAQFEAALAQINEAISLNPNNTDAARIKDRLLNRMNIPGSIVLNSEDEEQYQRAVRELQAGNNLVALAITDRLLQNPRNRNITKLVELQRRIQSVL